MEFENGILQFNAFFAVTIGIVVLFAGKRVNDVVRFLREFSIPEPVTGGLIFSILIALVYVASGVEIGFDLEARDILLVYFFTTIGINASLRDLRPDPGESHGRSDREIPDHPTRPEIHQGRSP